MVINHETREAHETVTRLRNRLLRYRTKNKPKAQFYDAARTVKDLGIAVPPRVAQLVRATCGWPAVAVDTIEERLDLLGFSTLGTTEDPYQLADIYNANALDVESSLVHLDALVYGIGLTVTGLDDDGTPRITAESVNNATIEWDAKKRQPKAAIVEWPADRQTGRVAAVDLYTPGKHQRLDLIKGRWTAQEEPTLYPEGLLPVTPFVNRPYASHTTGRSEISEAVRFYTEEAMRVLLRASLSGELFSTQQLFFLGADEDDFTDPDGNLLDRWEMMMGRIRTLPRDENGQVPDVKHIAQSLPTPHTEQLNMLARMLASECGIPVDNLGLIQSNPSSAEAIIAAENRLVRRTMRRQQQFGNAWANVARQAVTLRDGVDPGPVIQARWRDASTPTQAASADAAAKLVGAQILPAESQVVLDRVGITPAEQAIIKTERATAQARENLLALFAPTNTEEPAE